MPSTKGVLMIAIKPRGRKHATLQIVDYFGPAVNSNVRVLDGRIVVSRYENDEHKRVIQCPVEDC